MCDMRIRISFSRISVSERRITFALVLNILSILLLVATTIIVIVRYNMLPADAQVPTHWGASGEADAWSGKGSLFVPLALAYFMCLITMPLSFMKPYEMLNMPGTLKERAFAKNPVAFNNTVRGFLAVMSFTVIFVSSWSAIASSFQLQLGIWFLPVIILLIVAPFVALIVRLVLIARG